MRAEGEGRKSKIETTRLVGIGMMLAGVLAFTFAVVGPSGAGASNTAATSQHQTMSCQNTYGSGTVGSVAQAINQGCHTTTSYTKPTCTCTSTTWGTTTTGSTTTSTSSTTTSTTTTTGPTGPSGATGPSGPTGNIVSGSTTTTSTENTGPTEVLATTTTSGHKSVVVQGTTETLAPQQIAVSPTSGVLPFTGSSPAPLAGLGLVLIATGAGLSRRKRRLAD